MGEQDDQKQEVSQHHVNNMNKEKLNIAVKGDTTTSGFQKWYDEYRALDGNSLSGDNEILLAVANDILDNQTFEEDVAKFTAHVKGGFCLQCQNLFNNWPDLQANVSEDVDPGQDSIVHKEGWEHHVSLKRFRAHELEASTRQGCRFCALIRQILIDTDMLEIYRKVEARVIQFDEDAKMALSIQNWGKFSITKCQLLWPNLPGKICTSCNSGTALSTKFLSGVVPIPDGSSIAQLVEPVEDVFGSARMWMKTCIEEHENCKADENRVLPTRLLSIAADPPKLVLTADLEKTPRYATLSHIWGKDEPSKLTTENLDSRLNSTQVEDLPKAFTDAVRIAREIHLEYLWIDSLCIVQDNEVDWIREASLMTSVYGGTSLNIAAYSSTDSSKGCFNKRPNYSGGTLAKIVINGQERVQDFKEHETYERVASKSFLAGRAWALQERLLAPRTIYFGDRGAFWECGGKIASEFLPDGFGKILVHALVNRKLGLRDYWRDIVLLYSAANLTYGKDKLPALSGIAQRTFNERKDQYLAGMWRDDIETQLCWRPDVPRSRPAYRAPTWSWTSVDGRVMYPVNQKGKYEDSYTHLVDAEMTAAGEDPFGQVTGGLLRLSCCAIIAGQFDEVEKVSGISGRGQSITVMSDVETKKFFVWSDCKDDMSGKTKAPVYLLPIIGGRTGMGHSSGIGQPIVNELMVHGILLQETGVTKGEFSRIGSFGFAKNPSPFNRKRLEYNEDYESFLKILEGIGMATAKSVCAEVASNDKHPKEQYIITVI